MTLFRVTYPNKTSADTESSDCHTVEAFANTHFGSSYEVAQEHGATVEIMEPGTPPVSMATPVEPEVLSGAEVVAEVTGEPAPEPVKAKKKK